MSGDLDKLNRAERLLAQVAITEDAQHVARLAEAARVWAQQAKLGTQAVNHATVIKIRAERKLADLVDRGQADGEIATPGDRGRPRRFRESGPAPGPLPPTLADLGISKQRLGEARRLRDGWTEDQLARAAEAANAADLELSRAELLRLAGAGLADHQLLNQSLGNEWYTPAEVIEAARAVLGGIDLDPASCPAANATVQAARYFTAADNGLSQPWKGRMWLNPPYGGQAGAFVTKLVDHYRADDVEAAIVLVAAPAASTAWFRSLWKYPLCFTFGRLAFTGPGVDRSANTHGSAIAYLGGDVPAFAREFRAFGQIVLSADSAVLGALLTVAARCGDGLAVLQVIRPQATP